MIETLSSQDPTKVVAWLEERIRPRLRQDVSSYAKGRLRAWLGIEPMLFAPFEDRQGVGVPEKLIERLQDLLGWTFDYCLVTYSGDRSPIGISAHRDAGYAANEAYSWNLSGQCVFDYWTDRGGKPESKSQVILEPGAILKFDCKHLHAAAPSVGRWNMNFWKRKPSKIPQKEDLGFGG